MAERLAATRNNHALSRWRWPYVHCDDLREACLAYEGHAHKAQLLIFFLGEYCRLNSSRSGKSEAAMHESKGCAAEKHDPFATLRLSTIWSLSPVTRDGAPNLRQARCIVIKEAIRLAEERGDAQKVSELHALLEEYAPLPSTTRVGKSEATSTPAIQALDPPPCDQSPCNFLRNGAGLGLNIVDERKQEQLLLKNSSSPLQSPRLHRRLKRGLVVNDAENAIQAAGKQENIKGSAETAAFLSGYVDCERGTAQCPPRKVRGALPQNIKRAYTAGQEAASKFHDNNDDTRASGFCCCWLLARIWRCIRNKSSWNEMEIVRHTPQDILDFRAANPTPPAGNKGFWEYGSWDSTERRPEQRLYRYESDSDDDMEEVD